MDDYIIAVNVDKGQDMHARFSLTSRRVARVVHVLFEGRAAADGAAERTIAPTSNGSKTQPVVFEDTFEEMEAHVYHVEYVEEN